MRIGELFLLAAVAALATFALRTLAHRLGARLPNRLWIFLFALPFLGIAPRLVGGEILAPPPVPGTLPGLDETHPLDDRFRILNDVQFQLVPWETEVRRLLDAGAPPFWSHTLAGGSCLWCNPQAQVASPIAWATRVFPIEQHFLVGLFVKILVAATGAAALARRLALRAPFCALAAATFALSGGIFAWGLFPLSSTVAWIPWVVTAAIASARRRRSGAGAIATTLATAAVVVALLVSGHPESAALGLVLAACAAIALGRRRRMITGATRFAAATVLAILLAAPVLLPAYLTVTQSTRLQELRREAAVPHADRAPLERLFPPEERALALGPLGPDVYGRPYREEFRGPYNWPTALATYSGVLGLVGCALAFAARRRIALPFLLFALLGGLVAMRFAPLEKLRAWLPLFDAITPNRFLPVVCLALTIVGVLGWSALARGRHRNLFLLAGAVALALATSLYFSPSGRTALEATVAGALVVLTLRSRPGAGLLIAGAQTILMATWAWGLLPATSRELFSFSTPTFTRLSEALEPFDDPRLVGFSYIAYPNLLPLHGVADVRFHDPLVSTRYAGALAAGLGFEPTMHRYFAPAEKLDPEFLAASGVCCILAMREHRPFVPPARIVELDERFDLHVVAERTAALRRLPETIETPPVVARREANRVIAHGLFPAGSRIETHLTSPESWLAVPATAVRATATSPDTLFYAVESAGHEGELVLRFVPHGFTAGAIAAATGSLAFALYALLPPLRARRREPVAR